MDAASLDALNANKTMHYLITPYTQWDAYRYGIIDKNGKIIKAPSNTQENSAFNLFHMMIIKLRGYLEKTPGYYRHLQAWNAGQELAGVRIPAHAVSSWSVTNRMALPVMAAAYNAMREAVETKTSSTDLPIIFERCISNITDAQVSIFEDAVIGTSTATVGPTMADPGNNPVVQPKKKKRKLKDILTVGEKCCN